MMWSVQGVDGAAEQRRCGGLLRSVQRSNVGAEDCCGRCGMLWSARRNAGDSIGGGVLADVVSGQSVTKKMPHNETVDPGPVGITV